MQCPLCGHPKINMARLLAVSNATTVLYVTAPLLKPLIPFTTYRRQTPPETIRHVLQSHAERGVAYTTGLAYNIVVALVPAVSQRSQQLHNGNVLAVYTDDVSVDEMWSFMKKSRNTVSQTS